MSSNLFDGLQLAVPVIQAPMAGTSTPLLASEVCNAGGLGSIAIGAVGVAAAEEMIQQTRSRTNRPFNVNVFCHTPAVKQPQRERAWIERFTDEFRAFGVEPPKELHEIYKSFSVDSVMLEMLVRQRPAVVSFHFGLPPMASIEALKDADVMLWATVTNLGEAKAAAAAGIDVLVAQGYEAGGHRGVFDPDANDPQLSTLALVQLLAHQQALPVVAAGGIMNGAGIAAALHVGAAAVQMGTAFIACPESAADDGFRAALASDAAYKTTMTRVISGRPARCLANRFTQLGKRIADGDVPSYPIAYDLGKALHTAAKARGEYGFGAQWAGQGAPLIRPMPAARLVQLLRDEFESARAGIAR